MLEISRSVINIYQILINIQYIYCREIKYRILMLLVFDNIEYNQYRYRV